MAAGSKLVIQYATADGESVNHTWNYADPYASDSNVQAAAEATLTNGSIFQKEPIMVKSAKIVTTTEKVIDINN